MEPALHQIGSPSRKAMLCWLRQIISGIFGPWVELLESYLELMGSLDLLKY